MLLYNIMLVGKIRPDFSGNSFRWAAVIRPIRQSEKVHGGSTHIECRLYYTKMGICATHYVLSRRDGVCPVV